MNHTVNGENSLFINCFVVVVFAYINIKFTSFLVLDAAQLFFKFFQSYQSLQSVDPF